MLMPFRPKPGIDREGTAYSAQGGWFDCDLVRFRSGHPEKIGGWVRNTLSAVYGVCRALFSWMDLGNVSHLAIGTNLKYYISTGGLPADITPIRRTTTLAANPITTTNGLSTVIVNDPIHGAIQGDFVTLSGFIGTFNGIPNTNLNGNFPILSIIDGDNYIIDTLLVASTGGSTGGSGVTAAYEINVGITGSVVSPGYGAGGFGGVSAAGNTGWGQASTSDVVLTGLRLWSQTNFGEDLLFCPRGGALYYWKSDPPDNRALPVLTKPGASDVPLAANEVLVTWSNRQCMAFGCNPIGSTQLDPLMIRWSDNESVTQWTPLTTNSAGGIRISSGSQIVTAVQTHTEIVIFTDISLYSAQLVGAPFIWGVFLVSPGISIMGPNAKVNVQDTIYWMGVNNFYKYDGHASPLACSVKDYVFNDFNMSQAQKVVCGSNRAFNEVWWFYPSSGCDEIDRYVVFNYVENIWYIGRMCRTAWLDRGLDQQPLGAFIDGFIYDHEVGNDDGSTLPPSPLIAYVQSAPIEGDGTGSKFIFISRIIPDITFRGTSGTVNIVLSPQDYPGDNYKKANTAVISLVSENEANEQEIFTQQVFTRLRGRSIVLEVNSITTGTAWRLGTPRLDIRPDGRR